MRNEDRMTAKIGDFRDVRVVRAYGAADSRRRGAPKRRRRS